MNKNTRSRLNLRGFGLLDIGLCNTIRDPLPSNETGLQSYRRIPSTGVDNVFLGPPSPVRSDSLTPIHGFIDGEPVTPKHSLSGVIEPPKHNNQGGDGFESATSSISWDEDPSALELSFDGNRKESIIASLTPSPTTVTPLFSRTMDAEQLRHLLVCKRGDKRLAFLNTDLINKEIHSREYLEATKTTLRTLIEEMEESVSFFEVKLINEPDAVAADFVTGAQNTHLELRRVISEINTYLGGRAPTPAVHPGLPGGSGNGDHGDGSGGGGSSGVDSRGGSLRGISPMRANAKACGERLKANRVEKRCETVVGEINDLSAKYDDIYGTIIDKDSDVLRLFAKFKTCEAQVETVRKKGNRLLECAIDIADDAAATQLDTALMKLEESQEAAQRFLNEAQVHKGITNLEQVDKAKREALTKPVFDPATAKDDDFFVFKRKFNDYVASINSLTAEDTLNLLKEQCLVGTARAMCAPFEELDQCWTQLNMLYGNIPAILAEFKAQTQSLPNCPGGRNLKGRLEWYVRVRTLLLKTQRFAEENKYTCELYTASTNIHNLVRMKMLFTDSQEVGKAFRELTDGNGVQDNELCYTKLLAYINAEIETASGDLSLTGLELAMQTKNQISPSSHAPTSGGSKRERRDGDKKVFATRNLEDRQDLNDDDNHGEQGRRDDDDLRGDAGWQGNDGRQSRDKPRNKEVKKGGDERREKRLPTPPLVQTGSGTPPQEIDCKKCGKKHTHLYYCAAFLEANVKSRFKQAQYIKICFRCLRMDSQVNFASLDAWWESHKNNCRSAHICNAQFCASNKYRLQKHILICPYHTRVNRARVDDFIEKHANLPVKSNLLHIQPENATYHYEDVEADGHIPDPAGPGLFMMQQVVAPSGKIMHVFFDSGCGSAGITAEAARHYQSKTVRPGPTCMSVASGQSLTIPGGDDKFYLELEDNRKATVIGIVMNKLTSTFPRYDLQQAYCELTDQLTDKNKPTVPDNIGGVSMDIIIGIKYSYLFPRPIVTLPGGLTLSRSPLKGANGHQGVISGPHSAWQQAEQLSNFMGTAHFFTSELRALHDVSASLWASGKSWIASDTPTLVEYTSECEGMMEADVVEFAACHAKQIERRFLESESIGTESLYRCPAHRNCADCRDGDALEMSSFKEEIEQALIEKSVEFDAANQSLKAHLPFISNPVEELEPNRYIAQKILEGQLRKLQKSDEVKQQVLDSHQKLVSRGYSTRLTDLPAAEREMLDNLPGDYYLPWRFVHKEGSLSTPVRCVFDASSRTKTGKSLNDCLAKGQNKLEKILSLLINFRAGPHAFTCDIKMAYNQLRLETADRRWHKYLWCDDLMMHGEVHTRVLNTLIYGVVSSGNQTTEGIAKLAKHCKQHSPEHAEGAEILEHKTYVDDASDAADSRDEIMRKVDGVDYTLALGSMTVKSYVISGDVPHETVARDGRFVSLLGYQWEPLTDRIGLEPKELFFGRTERGKRPEAVKGDVKTALEKHFTKRTILSKIAGNYDPLGLFTPVTAAFKIDYSELSDYNLGWDDGIPVKHLDRWVRHLHTMSEMQNVTFPRPVTGSEANVTLITCVDASQHLGIASVHARYETASGGVVVQLVAAKSKIVQGATIPRAELKAAVVGSVLADVVTKHLKGKVVRRLFVTDSSIVLSWINQDTRPMSIAVRNGVIEVRRFTDRSEWRHVDTKLNIADLGTRCRATVNDIAEGSDWQQGPSWMYLPVDRMPLRTLQQLAVSNSDAKEIQKELKNTEFSHHTQRDGNGLIERYVFSQYIFDPCAKGWQKAINVLVYVRRFCYWHFKQKPRTKTLPGVLHSSDCITPEERQIAKDYYFAKATAEVRKFMPKKDYQDVTTEKNGILHYSARVLDNQQVVDVANVMADIGPLHFVRPVVDRFSPVAYSIMLYVHEHVVSHRNVNTVLLESRQIAFIFGGRDLAKEIRKACMGCRRHKARLLEVEMGKLHQNRLTIAPPFYHTQVDLMGPFYAHCEHNHRSTVKVWGAVFRDPSCGAVSVHAMASYSTDAFIGAFMRFSHAHGFPAKIFIDAGSQLKKACEDMHICITDINSTINGKFEIGIEHVVAPTAAHHYQGCVERSIAEVKKVFYLAFSGIKLDVLSYETAFSYAANEINNLPICLGSRVEDLGNLDVITPSRLMFGRNNRRAPTGMITLTRPGRLLKQMEQVYESWWTVWAKEKLADYVPKPAKFSHTAYQPSEGDVCVFLLDRGEAINQETWRLGRVVIVHKSNDGLIRSVTVEYVCGGESKPRRTRRGVRRIAVLFGESEVFLVEQLNAAARTANKHFMVQGAVSCTATHA